MDGGRLLRTTGFVVLAMGAAVALGGLVVRDQMSRNRRELFSAHPLRRLAALGYLATREASVEAIHLLRDFIAWERRPMLRSQARFVLTRMEQRLHAAGEPVG
jgi:hypothetical protein